MKDVMDVMVALGEEPTSIQRLPNKGLLLEGFCSGRRAMLAVVSWGAPQPRPVSSFKVHTRTDCRLNIHDCRRHIMDSRHWDGWDFVPIPTMDCPVGDIWDGDGWVELARGLWKKGCMSWFGESKDG